MATAAAEIVHAACSSAVDQMSSDAPGWLRWMDEEPRLPPAPPPMSFAQPLKPPDGSRGHHPSAPSEAWSAYLGDLPAGASGDKSYLQVRNLDTGEMIPLEEADAKLHSSLTQLTPRTRARALPANSPRMWAPSGMRLGSTRAPGQRRSVGALGLRCRSSSSADASAASATGAAGGGAAEPTSAKEAADRAANLARRAVIAEQGGDVYAAISFYRQSIRTIRLTMRLLGTGAESGRRVPSYTSSLTPRAVDARTAGVSSGVSVAALEFYARAYAARATKLERTTEELGVPAPAAAELRSARRGGSGRETDSLCSEQEGAGRGARAHASLPASAAPPTLAVTEAWLAREAEQINAELAALEARELQEEEASLEAAELEATQRHAQRAGRGDRGGVRPEPRGVGAAENRLQPGRRHEHDLLAPSQTI